MKVDYKAIADDVDLNSDADYEAAFARMSAETITETKDIETSLIKQYLILMDKWLPLKNSVDDSAIIAVDALNIFETFRLTDESTGTAVQAKLSAMLDALIAAGLIDANDKAVILAMGQQSKPKWPGLSVGHVASAIDKRRLGEI